MSDWTRDPGARIKWWAKLRRLVPVKRKKLLKRTDREILQASQKIVGILIIGLLVFLGILWLLS